MNHKEFENFKSAEPLAPSTTLSDKILARVYNDLNPSALKVFSKLSLIHFFVSCVTLSFCAQFGFRLFGDGMGLMGYFMPLGAYGCMVACGFIFLGASVATAMLILRPEEIQVIRHNKLLKLGSLTFLSLGFFTMLRTEIVLGYALAWAMGSILGGILTLEVAWVIRAR